ncbi:MAG TPA: carbohydrate porin [Acetobacteraceae bacterium]|nr:carbohydrate porin [Acetobacteraceae bacterium]
MTQLPPARQRPRRRVRPGIVTYLAGSILVPLPALADGAQGGAAPAAPTVNTGLIGTLFAPSRTNLLGDMGGLRPALDQYGISLSIQEISEVFGNVTGGTNRAAEYDGLTTLALALDTEKAFGWQGGTFNVSALQIHGRNLSDEVLDSIQTASGIEADRATRLWELWYQQAFLDGQADVKIGQQSLDQEFMISQNAALFANTMMGWPTIPSVDMYAGGPGYPLSSLGVRLRARPTDALTILAGVFDDNPTGGSFANATQLRGAAQSGTAFNLDTGALWIAELQYAINQPVANAPANAPPPSGLPGTYKIGVWFDTGSFPDQRYDDNGLSLANPASDGQPLMRRHDFSLYGVADQMVWRPDPQSPQSVNVFARVMGAPPDRNLVNFALNAGVTLKAPLPGRDNDTFGIGYGLASVSSRASGLDRDIAFYSGSPYPIRGSESFIEVTYQAQLAPWWQVQPDFQYVFTPSGGIPNPNQPGQRIGNEAILGLRTTVTF